MEKATHKKRIFTADNLVSEIVVDDYKTAAVFKKYGIDFCCGGGISVQDASKQEGIEIEELLKALNELPESVSNNNIIGNLELDTLVEHIINIHHSYVRRKSPEITSLLSKIVEVHADHHLELKKVLEIFGGIEHELLGHMEKEENILFPYIKKLARTKRENGAIDTPPFGTIKNPIRMMEEEHEVVGKGFKEIRSITNDFFLPEDACTTYRTTFSLLNEFEDDLHQHIHLENNILFPRAIEMEEELLS